MDILLTYHLEILTFLAALLALFAIIARKTANKTDDKVVSVLQKMVTALLSVLSKNKAVDVKTSKKQNTPRSPIFKERK